MVHAPNAFTIVKETENRGIDELKKKKKLERFSDLTCDFISKLP